MPNLDKNCLKKFALTDELRDNDFTYDCSLGDIVYGEVDNKAFIEILHGHLPKEVRVAELMKFMNDMYGRTDKIILGAFIEVAESGFDDISVQTAGFYGGPFKFRSLNPQFLELVLKYAQDEETKQTLIEFYKKQISVRNAHFDKIRAYLEYLKEDLQELERIGRTSMIDYKTAEIATYEEILNSESNKQSRTQ